MYTPQKCSECGAEPPPPNGIANATLSGQASEFEAESDLWVRRRTLLESNEPPVDSEIPFFQSVVARTTARLARLETSIAQLRCQLEILDGEHEATSIELTRVRSILSPLRQMPAEVLCDIFSWTLPSPRSALRRERLDTNESPWVLGRICHRWRAVAVSTPSLWTAIAMTYPQRDGHFSLYPLPAAVIQLERAGNARSLKIHFHGSESQDTDLDTDPQVEMFRLLSEHSVRWEELSMRITSNLAPLLAALRGRLPALRQIWFERATGCMFNELLLIPTSLPTHQLTRYHLNAPWRIHREVLKAAQNLVEARIEIDSDGEHWLEPEGTIILSHLRRLSVTDCYVWTYLQASALEEIAFECNGDDAQNALRWLKPFVARSSCTLRTLSIKGVPDATVTKILQEYPSIVKFALIVCAANYARNSYSTINNLVSRFMVPFPYDVISPQLAEFYLGCQGVAYIDSLGYLAMIRSRWNARECPLKTAAFLTHTAAPPLTRTGFDELQKEGLEVLWLEGADSDASGLMEGWGFEEDWK